MKILYALASVALFFYSYTQVDLSLTLSRVSIWQVIQQRFQSIGYFNRPFSVMLFLTILAIFFFLYIMSLYKIGKHTLNIRQMWVIIGIITVLTCFSYPAFSYDFFNYLFTAKTVLLYHRNPYAVTPLQFSGVEPWLSFLHWTHLPSAYTPLWITVTLLPYIFGFGYFLLILWNLKIVIAAAYVLTAIGIYKILQNEDKSRALLGMAIFALNPLVIIESLVSAHNDILMMALAVWAIVLFQRGSKWGSWMLLSLSVAMKLMTLTLIPVFFMKWNRRVALLSIFLGFIAVVFQREVLGWYWVWIVPFVALVPDLWPLVVLSTGVSLGLLLRYAPFLYLGNWNDPAPILKMWGTIIPIVISVIIVFVSYFRKKS